METIMTIKITKDLKRFYYKPFISTISFGDRHANIAYALGLTLRNYNKMLVRYGALKHRYGYYFSTLELAQIFINSDELLGLLVMNKLIK